MRALTELRIGALLVYTRGVGRSTPYFNNSRRAWRGLPCKALRSAHVQGCVLYGAYPVQQYSRRVLPGSYSDYSDYAFSILLKLTHTLPYLTITYPAREQYIYRERA